MASALNKNSKGEMTKGNIDLLNDTIKYAWMDPSYTFDPDNDDYYSDISSDIASGSTDGTLSSKTVTANVFDSANPSQVSQTITGGTDKVILYKDTGTPATSSVIGCFDIVEGTLTPINGTLAIGWSASGIFSL